MAARPTNIGIKAIELYFPSQASLSPQHTLPQNRASLYPAPALV